MIQIFLKTWQFTSKLDSYHTWSSGDRASDSDKDASTPPGSPKLTRNKVKNASSSTPGGASATSSSVLPRKRSVGRPAKKAAAAAEKSKLEADFDDLIGNSNTDNNGDKSDAGSSTPPPSNGDSRYYCYTCPESIFITFKSLQDLMMDLRRNL